MVHWIRGPSSISESIKITMLSLFFEFSPCRANTYPVSLVWDVARHGLSTRFLKHPCFFFRFSFRHTSDLSPLPFSAITKVINNHTRRSVQNTRKLHFVCNYCWIYLRLATTLHEPCRGCALLESMDWEFWTSGRGRSAWWRHPLLDVHIIFQ